MIRTMLQARLHRVKVTQANLDYEGSCGIDEALLDASGLREYQYTELYNLNNGERLSTCIIKAARGWGANSLNCAAARKAMVGDLLIICACTRYTDSELEHYEPSVVAVDEHNVPRLKPSLRAAS